MRLISSLSLSAKARRIGLATRIWQKQAHGFVYQAIQSNFVAISNEGAVWLWLKPGHDQLGRLPKAFNHPSLGMIDALVRFKR